MPFQITIEALGHKMHYMAFLEYRAAGRAQMYEADNEWVLAESSCENKIKILSYKDTPEPGSKTRKLPCCTDAGTQRCRIGNGDRK